MEARVLIQPRLNLRPARQEQAAAQPCRIADFTSFRDLNTLMDDVHALFDQWEQEDRYAESITIDTLMRLRLSLHEWLANLVQHADFAAATPEITLSITPGEQKLHCSVQDNAAFFDLIGELGTRHDELTPMPDRGMGLLMLQACTDHLAYYPIDGARNQLSFTISDTDDAGDPWLNIPFSS
ncbi:MAG: ATP-binding protein [Bacteroidota bacterium]